VAYLQPWIAVLRAWLRVRSDQAFEVAALRRDQAPLLPDAGFGNFASASGFCTAFDELNDCLMMRRRGQRRPSLADQRRRFSERWQTLIGELAAS
jgi:hypothetical protein